MAKGRKNHLDHGYPSFGISFLIVFYLWYSNREETSGNEAESKAKLLLLKLIKITSSNYIFKIK